MSLYIFYSFIAGIDLRRQNLSSMEKYIREMCIRFAKHLLNLYIFSEFISTSGSKIENDDGLVK